MRLGPYELVRMIGAGGMGEVWAAHRVGASGHEVLAVKRLPERLAHDPTFRQILLEEARLAMLLRHPNIVHVFDAGEADAQAYIAMEFVHGLDLARLRKQMEQTGERLPMPVIAYVIGQILTALDYAHNLVHDAELLSLVHRDISPHNVILSVDGEVKLADFGVARLSNQDTSGTHVKGKARYMPPEQLRGESRSPTVDLFAAGAVLQEMLDGSVFRGEAIDDARLLGMAVDGTVPAPQRPQEIPRTLERLRRGLLAPDPRQRIRSASEALELLQGWHGYADASTQVAQIVLRSMELHTGLERQAGGAQLPTGTGLAHQATLLHTKDSVGSEDPDDFLAFDRLADESMLSEPLVQTARSQVRSAEPHSRGAPTGDAVTDVESEFALDDDMSWSATGGHRSVEQLAASELVLDIANTGNPRFARHVATSPNPVVPKRRLARALASLAIMAGVAAAGFAAVELIDVIQARRGGSLMPTPTSSDSGLRKARVIGDNFPGYAGFRHRRMDMLANEDILYEYLVSPGSAAGDAKDPLTALAAGDAEFALTTLDQLLLARANTQADAGPSAKIVALVDVSVGADALVLDSVEHPSLRSLDDLAKLGRKLGHAPVLASVSGAPSAYLELRLDTLLSAIHQPALNRANDYAHAQAVYDALTASADPDAPIVAAMLSEPWLSKARDAGMTVAASTSDLPDAVINVLVASDHALEHTPELVDAVVASYYQVVRTQQTEPTEHEALIQKIVAVSGLTEAEATQTLLGLCRLDAAGAEPWLRAIDKQPALLGAAIDATWSTLQHHALVAGTAPSLDSLVAAGPVTAAVASEREHAELAREHTCIVAPSSTSTRPAQALGELELPGADTPWFVAKDTALSAGRPEQLPALAARLRSFNPTTVAAIVTGFGEARGGKGRALGQARARSLVDALQAAGVEIPLDPRGAPSNAAAPASQLRISLSRIDEG